MAPLFIAAHPNSPRGAASHFVVSRWYRSLEQYSLDPAAQAAPLWPFVVYVAAVVALVAIMLGLSYVLGERHREPATGEPYESGIKTTGSARLRLSAKFYLIAMFFVIFDLEAVFIIAWALSVRELGWAGYIEILVFIGFLLVALVYLWRVGALDWGPETLKNRKRT